MRTSSPFIPSSSKRIPRVLFDCYRDKSPEPTAISENKSKAETSPEPAHKSVRQMIEEQRLKLKALEKQKCEGRNRPQKSGPPLRAQYNSCLSTVRSPISAKKESPLPRAHPIPRKAAASSPKKAHSEVHLSLNSCSRNTGRRVKSRIGTTHTTTPMMTCSKFSTPAVKVQRDKTVTHSDAERRRSRSRSTGGRRGSGKVQAPPQQKPAEPELDGFSALAKAAPCCIPSAPIEDIGQDCSSIQALSPTNVSKLLSIKEFCEDMETLGGKRKGNLFDVCSGKKLEYILTHGYTYKHHERMQQAQERGLSQAVRSVPRQPSRHESLKRPDGMDSESPSVNEEGGLTSNSRRVRNPTEKGPKVRWSTAGIATRGTMCMGGIAALYSNAQLSELKRLHSLYAAQKRIADEFRQAV